MQLRQDRVEDTRLRITEATVRLHERVGPAQTTVSAVAQEAGVTRLTVYRHFPDEEALVRACSAHWETAHPPPDPAAWERVSDAHERLRRGLTETYRWWPSAAPMMSKVLRDLDAMPPFVRDQLHRDQTRRVDVLVRGVAGAAAADRRLRAVVAHALSLQTWRSLCEEGGLADEEAVGLMLGLARAAVEPRRRPPPGGR